MRITHRLAGISCLAVIVAAGLPAAATTAAATTAKVTTATVTTAAAATAAESAASTVAGPTEQTLGEVLRPGQMVDQQSPTIGSASGQYLLLVGGSEELTSLAGASCILAVHQNYSSFNDRRVVMQFDGNLVDYDAAGNVYFASGTHGNPGAYAALQNDGNLVVYSAAGRALWASGTTCSELRSYNTPIDPGTSPTFDRYLLPGWTMTSPTRTTTLAMQGDGNLVVYRGGRALWSSGTAGRPGARAVLQGDGNLVVYSAGGRALWASGTSGNRLLFTSVLALQSDGNLVLDQAEFEEQGTAVWSAGTARR